MYIYTFKFVITPIYHSSSYKYLTPTQLYFIGKLVPSSSVRATIPNGKRTIFKLSTGWPSLDVVAAIFEASTFWC